MNKLTAGKASILAITAVLAVSAFLLGKSLKSLVYASGQPTSVIICHATDSSSNPYVTQSPNIQNDGSLTGGHLNHTGPVYPNADWGDIIPPYTHGTFVYAGMNWTVDGQAIWKNGCNIPGAPTPSPSPSPSPSGSPEPSSSPTESPSPEPQFHSVCRELSCVLVQGAGTNSCATDVDCEPAASPTPQTCTGDQHLGGDGITCVSFSPSGPAPSNGGPTGQVLGASTMAGTGSFTENLFMAIMGLGATLSSAGFVLLKKASKLA